ESAGVDLREHVDEVVMKDDVARSKPNPDVVVAALRKLRLCAAQCAMVGDTPHDAEAAKRAGVVTLGVLCGGYNDERTLVSVGARAFNQENALGDRTAHAELMAFRRLAESRPRDERSPRDLVLVSTVEPCVMCLGAAIVSAVDTVVHALAAPADGGTLRVRNP